MHPLVALPVLLAAALSSAPGAAKAPAHNAEATTPLPSLQALLTEARTHNPGLQAAKRRWDAARVRAAGEGLLPDPMISASLMDLTGLQGPQVAVAQALPLGGKLALARRRAEQEAAVAKQMYREAVNQLLGDVKVAYWDLYYQQRTQVAATEEKLLATQMSRIAAARYAVGQGNQSDPARANVQVAQALHAELESRQQVDAAEIKLRGLLAAPAAASHAAAIPVPEVTPVSRPLEELVATAEARNPTLARARAEIAAVRISYEQATTIGTPDLTFQLGVGRQYMDMGWQTTLTGMVGSTLPFQQAQRRQAAAVTGAEAELAGREAALADERRRISTRIQEILSHLVHMREQVLLLRQGILPQARQALAAQLASYQVNKSDFTAWLSAQGDVVRFGRELHLAIADYQRMRAELDTLTGVDLPDEEAP